MGNVFLIILLVATNTLLAQQPRLVLPVGHTSRVLVAKFSPDGKKIVTASSDKTAKVWDAATSKLLSSLDGHTEWIEFVDFSPDGSKIVTASRDYTSKVWDVATGKILYSLEGHTGWVNSASFSPDGKWIVTSSEDTTAKIWDVTTGKIIYSLEGHGSQLNSSVFSPDGKKIVTTSSDNTAKIWDSHTGKIIYTLTGYIGTVQSAVFSPDGKKVFTASWKNMTWDVSSGKLIYTLEEYPGKKDTEFTLSIAVSPDGKMVVTASRDKTAKVWDVSSGKLIYTLTGHSGEVVSAVFSTDGRKIVTSSYDSTAKIWDVTTGKLIFTLNKHIGEINSAVFSPDGRKIVTASDDKTAMVWDVNSGKRLHTLEGHARQVQSAVFSPDGKKILNASLDNNAKIWDVFAGKIIFALEGSPDWVKSGVFSPNGLKIATISQNNTANLWDAITGKILHNFQGQNNFNTPRFSPGNNQLVTAALDNAAIIWDANSGNLLQHLMGHRNEFRSFEFSTNGKKIVTASWDKTVKIWEVHTGKLLHTLDGHTADIRSAFFSPDGSKIVTASWDKTATVWDAVTGEVLFSLNGHTDWVEFANFSPDGKKIVTTSVDKTAKIWSAFTGKLLENLNGHTDRVEMALFYPDGTRLITTSWDATVKIWEVSTGKIIRSISLGPNTILGDLNFSTNNLVAFSNSEVKVFSLTTGKQLVSYNAIDNKDYISILPNKYYMASSNVAKLLHYVNKDLKVITFEQLDVKYNRPDKVLEAIGNTDTGLIKSYRKAYEKRIKKLGIDTTSFRDGYSVPEADFVNRENIEYEQKNGNLTLHIKGIDSTYKLDRFNVWVNEVPVFGQRGFSIRKRERNDFDTTITIKLSQGENRIETSISNVNGTESYRMPLIVNYTPAIKQKEMTQFIGIGIDKFADNKYNLQYSSKDIRDLSIKLKEKYGDDIVIDTLFNENVTVSNVKALKQKLQQTTENDKVIIAYSGHGMLSKDYDYYLSTYTVNFEKPEETGLPYDELENLLDSIPARKKLMLIDACHSGEVDKEDLITLNASSDSLIKGFKPVAYKKAGQLGLKNSFELMQSLFVNVGKSTGATIISAAAGTEFALERNDLKNGVFTYAILEAMKNNTTMKISELKIIVGLRVEELTKGLQKPTSRNESIAVDWNVW